MFIRLMLKASNRPVLLNTEHVVTVTQALPQDESEGTLIHAVGMQLHVAENYNEVFALVSPVRH